jgi:hypothetical protein
MVPMNMITSSMLYTLAPVWKTALPASRIDELARLLERREAIPHFIRALDAGEEQRRLDERNRRAETR